MSFDEQRWMKLALLSKSNFEQKFDFKEELGVDRELVNYPTLRGADWV